MVYSIHLSKHRLLICLVPVLQIFKKIPRISFAMETAIMCQHLYIKWLDTFLVFFFISNIKFWTERFYEGHLPHPTAQSRQRTVIRARLFLAWWSTQCHWVADLFSPHLYDLPRSCEGAWSRSSGWSSLPLQNRQQHSRAPTNEDPTVRRTEMAAYIHINRFQIEYVPISIFHEYQ